MYLPPAGTRHVRRCLLAWTLGVAPCTTSPSLLKAWVFLRSQSSEQTPSGACCLLPAACGHLHVCPALTAVAACWPWLQARQAADQPSCAAACAGLPDRGLRSQPHCACHAGCPEACRGTAHLQTQHALCAYTVHKSPAACAVPLQMLRFPGRPSIMTVNNNGGQPAPAIQEYLPPLQVSDRCMACTGELLLGKQHVMHASGCPA